MNKANNTVFMEKRAPYIRAIQQIDAGTYGNQSSRKEHVAYPVGLGSFLMSYDGRS